MQTSCTAELRTFLAPETIAHLVPVSERKMEGVNFISSHTFSEVTKHKDHTNKLNTVPNPWDL